MKLVIDRKKWFRGQGTYDSRLLRDGVMCCLGFYACDLGFRNDPDAGREAVEAYIAERASPRDAPMIAWPEWVKVVSSTLPNGVFVNSDDISLLMAHNDNDNTEFLDYEREQRIAEIFARHDVEVEFVG